MCNQYCAFWYAIAAVAVAAVVVVIRAGTTIVYVFPTRVFICDTVPARPVSVDLSTYDV